MKKNWEVKKLGEVYDVRDGTHDSPKFQETGFALITSKNLTRNVLNYDKVQYISKNDYEKINQRSRVDKGDILFAMIGTIGHPVVIEVDPDFAIKNVALFKIPENQSSYFLKYYLDSKSVIEKMAREANGTTQKFVGLGYLRQFMIMLPPLPEQQRIVAILDEAFDAIARAKKNAEKNLQNAREIFEAYLQSVFSNPGNEWEEKTLGQVAIIKSGGTPLRSNKELWDGGDIPWYSSGELNDLYTCVSERCITEIGLNNSNAKLFPKGSLLVGMYDTAALKMSIIDRDAAFNQAIAGIKPNNDLDLIFILHAINAIKPAILNQRRGVRQKNLSLEKIKSITLFIPPLNEQHSIVAKLDALSTETKKLEAICNQKLTDLEELKNSILQKAFNGEL